MNIPEIKVWWATHLLPVLLRQAELDGEWWAKACRKSHEFAEDCLEADDALFQEVENGIGSSDSEDDDDLQEVEEELEEIWNFK